MRNLSLAYPLLLAGFLFCSCSKDDSVKKDEAEETDETGTTKKVYSLDMSKTVWADEFDYEGSPDPAKWSYDTGGNGWGNNELQNYTNTVKNASVKNGLLTITAIKEILGSNQYTSARLVSKSKGDILYGRIEVKAKLPSGTGTWPAIWMLPTFASYGNLSWPDNGEIDIMEHVGFDQGVVHANIHTKAFNHSIGTNKGDHINVANASQDFNVYACNWYPDSISFEVNGKRYFKFENNTSYNWTQWPFDRKFHILLNIAVGGNWGGQKGVDSAVFPQKMEVDYVRFYGIKEENK